MPAVIGALKADLAGPAAVALYCPRQAPSAGVVCYTYAQWFQPFSARRRYCQLPVSGRNMQRFLQFRLGCHQLPIAAGRRSGIARACRLCTLCGSGALGDEKHLVFECGALAGVRAKYPALFEACGHNMRAFFAQHDHLGVFHYVIDCLNFMDI